MSEVEASLIINENQMEIKRATEIIIKTNRKFVIRGTDSIEQCFCPDCGETLIGIDVASALFGISQLAVFRLVEQNKAHFAETESGILLICSNSLTEILATRTKITGEKL